MWGVHPHCFTQSACAPRPAGRPRQVPSRCRPMSSPTPLHAAHTAEQLAQLPVPPFTPLAGHEIGSFAHGTISKRLPAIVANIVADVKKYAEGGDADVASQAIAVVLALDVMAEEMRRDSPVQPVQVPPGADDTFAKIVQLTNACLEAETRGPSRSWWGYPWLLVECYMYVRISAMLRASSGFGPAYDPFNEGKMSAFTKSIASVVEIAQAVLGLVEARPEKGSAEMKKKLFEVVQYSLWGNKTDLSMLVDVANLETSSMAAQVSDGGTHPFLIVDEFDAVWSRLSQPSAGPRRLDIVLDNAGLELYGDFCLADVMLEYGLVDEVVFHGKLLPWFVSDTMDCDFSATLELCTSLAPDQPGSATVRKLAARWQGHVASGKWRYTDHLFWTTPCPFWWTEQVAPDLYSQLQSSFLIVFKGDLNYRKLAFDCRWPVNTPFTTATGAFAPAPFVSLRTLKADVMSGLKDGQGEQLDVLDKDWMVNGKFGIIQTKI